MSNPSTGTDSRGWLWVATGRGPLRSRPCCYHQGLSTPAGYGHDLKVANVGCPEAHRERLAQMAAWLADPTPLEQLRRRMPAGATLEDARRLRRLLTHEGRRFSKVPRDLTDEAP